MAVTIQRSAFLEALTEHDPSSVAVIDNPSGTSYSYGTLIQAVARARELLLLKAGRAGHALSGERIAFMVENGIDYVVTFLTILASNAIAVPLARSFPVPELRYIINLSESLVLVSSGRHASKASEVLGDGLDKTPLSYQLDPMGLNSDATEPRQIELCDFSSAGLDPEQASAAGRDGGGMMLFTSGTTARPKGVVLSLDNLTAQASSLHQAWQYGPGDRLLHVLPLHHIHGTVNALLTPLLAGSSIELMYPFSVDAVWACLAAPFRSLETSPPALSAADTRPAPITFLTAVPTIWARLLRAYDALSPEMQRAGRDAVAPHHLRLNISGSAALPKPIRDGWTQLSGGNLLLERYGMTEVGMALSCGLEDSDRVDGSVGWPLPGVEARLVETDEETGAETIIPTVAHGPENGASAGDRERTGEIQLRGPTVFEGYWRNPEATAKEFTADGWFKTGDIAVRRSVEGAGLGRSGSWAKGPAYFIQGRRSADIIKTGGEKVSALEIERELLALPQVDECAVVGLPSQAWGQKVVAVIVTAQQNGGENSASRGEQLTLQDLRTALKSRIVAYKIPQDMEVVDLLPRNAMGKVNKKELIASIFGSPENIRRRSVDLGNARQSAAARGK
ncbi:AMP-binding enzyme [Microdochium bolleyi]|uniref:AMP-binding enzyme n=1 Tax=Microdochium bolleyi TaxID=196109 RepID=A0A136IQI4_9PEZI|nr:AMP-binding enzyme [Microdochium bolleyi]